MRGSFFVAAALALGASFASAQVMLSPECTTAIGTALASPDGACLNPSGLIQVAQVPAGQSIVQPFDGWVQGFCAAKPCTNAALATLTTIIIKGCSQELAPLNITSADVNEAITVVQAVYPVFREIVCLKNGKTGQFCVTETLKAIEQSAGRPLSLGDVGPAVMSSSSDPAVVCTDCSKAAYNILKNAAPDIFTPDVVMNASNTCGPSFVDGANPSGITQSASSRRRELAAEMARRMRMRIRGAPV